MRRYDVKCPNGHVNEVMMEWDQSSEGCDCPSMGCIQRARVIITRKAAPMHWTDFTDMIDYRSVVGRDFNSSRDRDKFLEKEGLELAVNSNPRWQENLRMAREEREERLEVEGRGGDWKQYRAEKAAKERQAQQERFAKAGVRFTPLTSEEARSASEGAIDVGAEALERARTAHEMRGEEWIGLSEERVVEGLTEKPEVAAVPVPS